MLDTDINRKTAPLVHMFLNDLKSNDVFKKHFEDFKNYSDKIIESLLHNKQVEFFNLFKQISKLQLLYFSKMIPDSVKSFWAQGIEEGRYYTKLCGAGGGGFFLVYSREEKLVQKNIIPLNYEYER